LSFYGSENSLLLDHDLQACLKGFFETEENLTIIENSKLSVDSWNSKN
jgi:hypothetical protein